MNTRIILLLSSGFVLFGCANPLEHTINNFNENLEKTNTAYRYIKVENKDTYSSYQLEPAGKKQQTIAINSELLFSDTFKSLKHKCGFEKTDLIETRVVSHKHPQYYEVWIFKDALSERVDKTSAISVIFDVYENNAGTDISFSNNCHAKPRKITFGK